MGGARQYGHDAAPPPNTDDETLATRRSRWGSRRLPSNFVARHTPRLLRYLIARGLSPDAAQDVAQETWLKVWNALPSRQIGHFGGWLFTIARHAGEDHRKRRDNRPTSPVEALSLLPVTGPGPERLAADADTAWKLRDCIDGLSPECRDVLVGYLCGESYQELAGRLQIPVGTVKSRLSRAREQLRECLGADAS